MAERPEDLNLPNSVVARIIKEAVSRLAHKNLNKLEGAMTIKNVVRSTLRHKNINGKMF